MATFKLSPQTNNLIFDYNNYIIKKLLLLGNYLVIAKYITVCIKNPNQMIGISLFKVRAVRTDSPLVELRRIELLSKNTDT